MSIARQLRGAVCSDDLWGRIKSSAPSAISLVFRLHDQMPMQEKVLRLLKGSPTRRRAVWHVDSYQDDLEMTPNCFPDHPSRARCAILGCIPAPYAGRLQVAGLPFSAGALVLSTP